MGHARNYIAFDTVRRVLEDYFGYNLLYVMNVTDVDDKIIFRARRNHLLAQYRATATDPAKVKQEAEAALDALIAKQHAKHEEVAALRDQASVAAGSQPDDKARKKKENEHRDLGVTVQQEQHKLRQWQTMLAALQQAAPAAVATGGKAGALALVDVAADALADWLDAKLKETVTDKEIYRRHAARFEGEFMEDMEALGCRPPDVLTRVSEYIPEVVTYIQRILDNGMAYAVNGSIYFDTASFSSHDHIYGKLCPWKVGCGALAADGETNFDTSEKRLTADFALWKAAKPGEPSWPSPWGQGRPGWHIECSAMASEILGQRLDIHTGGEDLRFPHHDNELAQAEAHYHAEGCRQWVNYFLHSGHLSIEGLKMSKTLKNFVTIREALKTYSARQLRLMFVLQPWDKPMVYGTAARDEMRAKEALLKNFFQNVEVVLRQQGLTPATSKWQEEERELNARIGETQGRVHVSLLDNLNTREALDALCQLIKEANKYMTKRQGDAAGGTAQPLLLRKAAAYVTRILSVFGLSSASADGLGFGASEAAGAAGASSSESAQYLDAFAAFRDGVRQMAREAKHQGILAACDRVRDETLVDLGIKLEDKADGSSVWKPEDPAVLRAEQAERAEAAAYALRKKQQVKLDKTVKDLERYEKLQRLPSVAEALRDKYSQFDAEGNPTHDNDGNELEEKAKGKAKKEADKQRKVREPLQKLLAADPEALDRLRAEVKQQTEALRELPRSPRFENGSATIIHASPAP
ncbi:hypothetical protein WJX72_010713 [[Myrmecia] bisecta]|uniref:cysteine--tRNA ligase n=1 Tax=[Myrmecia] bisecta TaxID=41462 RepID=A0AAW1Q541_9CHLO